MPWQPETRSGLEPQGRTSELHPAQPRRDRLDHNFRSCSSNAAALSTKANGASMTRLAPFPWVALKPCCVLSMTRMETHQIRHAEESPKGDHRWRLSPFPWAEACNYIPGESLAPAVTRSLRLLSA